MINISPLYPITYGDKSQDAVAAMAHGCKAFTESLDCGDRIVIQWGYDGDLVGFFRGYF